MSDRKKSGPAGDGPSGLYKQHSWSPDVGREEAWRRRKEGSVRRELRRSRSVTDEDMDELKACIELGFGFDSPEPDRKLSDTLPALGFFYAVNKHYNDSVLVRTSSAASSESEADVSASPQSIFGPSKHSIASKALDLKACNLSIYINFQSIGLSFFLTF